MSDDYDGTGEMPSDMMDLRADREFVASRHDIDADQIRRMGFDPEAIDAALSGVTGAERIHVEHEPESIWEKPLDVSGMLETAPPDFDWVIDRRIQAGRGILVTGIGGSSKSTWLYHLAIGVTTGYLPWDWEVVKQGKVVLIMTEDTADDTHRALHKVSKNLTAEQKKLVSTNLIVYPLAGSDIKLLALAGGTMVKTELAERLEAEIKHIGDVVLIGIDPALEITEGDETNQSHQRSLGKYADQLAVKTSAAVILAAHSAKGTVNAEELTSHSARGAGALTDAVRGEYALRTMNQAEAAKAGIQDREERQRYVQMVATKGNHLPAAAYKPLWLHRDDDGALTGTDLDLEAEDSAEAVTRTHRDALTILEDMCQVSVPDLAQWQAACVENEIITAKTPAAQKKAMNRIRKALYDAGLIEKGMGRGHWMPATTET